MANGNCATDALAIKYQNPMETAHQTEFCSQSLTTSVNMKIYFLRIDEKTNEKKENDLPRKIIRAWHYQRFRADTFFLLYLMITFFNRSEHVFQRRNPKTSQFFPGASRVLIANTSSEAA
jgi:hypothetical protein